MFIWNRNRTDIEDQDTKKSVRTLAAGVAFVAAATNIFGWAQESSKDNYKAERAAASADEQAHNQDMAAYRARVAKALKPSGLNK